MTPTPHPVRRVLISLLAAGGVVAAGVLTAAPDRPPSANLSSTYDAQARQRAEVAAEQRPHTHAGATRCAGIGSPPLDDGHGHVHNDPTTKNAISRSGEAATAPDPRRPAQRAASRARVAAQRTLARAPPGRACRCAASGASCPRACTPWPAAATRSAGSRSPSRRPASAPTSSTPPTARSSPRPVRRRHLGGRPLTGRRTGPSARPAAAASPSPSPTAARCGVRRRGFATGAAEPFALRRTDGCTAFPEVETNVSGRPFGGVTSFQEVRGYVDPHVHGQTHEFLGGRVICSPPFHRYGAAAALVDCPDHQLADGRGAVLEDVLAGKTPGTGHDPVGWPTFSYWPNPHSLTHQQVYYKWLERSWRAGLRIHTSLLTENHILCAVYPLKKNSCDDRDAVRLQAADMRAMQDYIDAQYGGPGRGWYRIVTDPFEARKVINAGQARGRDGHGDVRAAGLQRPARAGPRAPRSRCSPSSPR